MNLSRPIAAALLVSLALIAPRASAATVRERLLESSRASEKLKATASPLPANTAKELGIESESQDQRGPAEEMRFARQSEATAYLRVRPWSAGYTDRFRVPSPAAEVWPTLAEAAELRALLKDPDAIVRSLAIESLATLHQPEDVPRIAEFLQDKSAGAMALGFAQQMSSMGWHSREADPVLPNRTWHARTVQNYVREALRLMTGHRFDGKDPRDITFADWWKTHDLGKESLWYWQERLTREAESAPALEKEPIKFTEVDHQKWQDAVAAHRAKLRAQSIKEIRQLSAEAEAKIFLIAHRGDFEITGPINSFFPDGLPLRIAAPELKALVERKQLWPDSADYSDAPSLFLMRAARVAAELPNQTPDKRALRATLCAALRAELADAWWMPPLYSRLLPAATRPEEIADPATREGYLQQALASKDTITRNQIAAEMVRTNLTAHWPALEKCFYAEHLAKGETSDTRQAIFQALGEAPHTPEKLRILVDLILDPRNDTIFTQENRVMGMDMYRVYAVHSLNAIAGKELVPFAVRQDMGLAGRSQGALAEFRRLAKEFAKR